MEGLALALQDRGVAVTLVDLSGFQPAADIVVIDSYRHSPDRARTGSALLAAVDDLGRDLAVDVLVDPAPSARAEEHPSAPVVLAGASYALVGPGTGLGPPLGRDVVLVLVAAGATDTEGWGAGIAARLHERLPDVRIRLVVGPWGLGEPPGVELVRAPPGLGPELQTASLVVTAAGVTMLESMCVGRPTVAFLTAENQRRQAEGARALGGIVLTDVNDAADEAIALVADADARLALAARGAALIDGQGPTRVAGRLVELAAGALR